MEIKTFADLEKEVKDLNNVLEQYEKKTKELCELVEEVCKLLEKKCY